MTPSAQRRAALAACALFLAASHLFAANILSESPGTGATLGLQTASRLDEPPTDAPNPGIRIVNLNPDSPARPNLAPDDILTRIDDQLLFLPEQLDAYLSTLRPGATVMVWRVRPNDTQAVSVVLGAAPPAAPPAAIDVREQPPAPATPTGDTPDGPHLVAVLEHVRAAYEQTAYAERLDDERETRFMEEVRRRLEDLYLQPPTTNADHYRVHSYVSGPSAGERDSHLQNVDGGSVTFSMRDGQQIVTYKDESGVVLFEGAADSAEGRQRLPRSAMKAYLEERRRSGRPPPVDDGEDREE